MVLQAIGAAQQSLGGFRQGWATTQPAALAGAVVTQVGAELPAGFSQVVADTVLGGLLRAAQALEAMPAWRSLRRAATTLSPRN